MEIGNFVLAWATVPLALTIVGYLLVAVGAKDFRLTARAVYWVLFALTALAFVDLFFLFVNNKFQFSYVASYSSSDLSNTWPHFYKVSALWAGQQGTFLLWLVCGLALGFWVKSKAGEHEGWVMFFYMLGQAFLLILTLVSNPFEKLNFVPPDGQGLNPLLQNYWMQIHPPIVFVGFAAACIPFAFAMAALATNKYDNWVKQTMPWTVFSVVTLGLGIFLGGYWAYETLGWGGYWAWDPVENASIIPWMVGIALIHGMVVERARGSWRRLNLFLAISLFLLIVYGTFLTRSGVLADFSVHSFTDLGYNNILWASLIIIGALGYGLWGIRAHRIKGAASSNEILSQEFTTFLAVALLLPFILLVLFWTSFPLISTVFSKLPLLNKLTPTPSAINTSYYNMAGLVFGAIFAIILGFNSLLRWNKTETEVLLKKIRIPLIVSLVSAGLFVIFGFTKIAQVWSADGTASVSAQVILVALLYFIFFFASIFALVTNTGYFISRSRSNFVTTGGYLAHIGFALLLIGIIISSSYGNRTKVSISQDETGKALGYDIKFIGTERISAKEERSYFDVTQGNSTFKAYSTSKEMRRGNQSQYVRTPYIKKYLLSDMYLSLENLTDGGQTEMEPFELKLGESANIAGNTILFSGYDSPENAAKLAKFQPQVFEVRKGESFEVKGMKITFEKFDMGQHESGMASQIGALLHVNYRGKTTDIIPRYEPTGEGQHIAQPVELPGGGSLILTAIKADIGAVTLTYSAGGEIAQIKIGTILKVMSGADSLTISPVFDPAHAHGEHSVTALPNGSQLYLLDVNAATNTASYVIVPPQAAQLATIEVSTKPMINLVWFGFSIIIIGSAISWIRRSQDRRKQEV